MDEQLRFIKDWGMIRVCAIPIGDITTIGDFAELHVVSHDEARGILMSAIKAGIMVPVYWKYMKFGESVRDFPWTVHLAKIKEEPSDILVGFKRIEPSQDADTFAIV